MRLMLGGRVTNRYRYPCLRHLFTSLSYWALFYLTYHSFLDKVIQLLQFLVFVELEAIRPENKTKKGMHYAMSVAVL